MRENLLVHDQSSTLVNRRSSTGSGANRLAAGSVGAVADRDLDAMEAQILEVQELGLSRAIFFSDGMQAPTGRLTEVCGQQQEREDDEQHQQRASTPDRLVVHEQRPSEAFMGKSTPGSAELLQALAGAGLGVPSWR